MTILVITTVYIRNIICSLLRRKGIASEQASKNEFHGELKLVDERYVYTSHIARRMVFGFDISISGGLLLLVSYCKTIVEKLLA